MTEFDECRGGDPKRPEDYNARSARPDAEHWQQDLHHATERAFTSRDCDLTSHGSRIRELFMKRALSGARKSGVPG